MMRAAAADLLSVERSLGAPAWISGCVIAITSALMVSRLPTPSIKYMKLQRQHRLLARFVLRRWRPVDCLALGHHDHRLLIYVASIPFAIFAHHPRYAQPNQFLN
jgi:phosphatidylserine synthase